MTVKLLGPLVSFIMGGGTLFIASASLPCSNSVRFMWWASIKLVSPQARSALAHGLSLNYLFTCCVCTSVPLEMIDRKNLNEHDLHLLKGRSCYYLPKYILAYHIRNGSSLQVLLLNRCRSHVGRTLSQVSKALPAWRWPMFCVMWAYGNSLKSKLNLMSVCRNDGKGTVSIWAKLYFI